MEIIHFDSQKHGSELLMDLGKFEETPQFFSHPGAHATDFYEIFFFRKAKGNLQLDNQFIQLKDHLIVFASPFQRRLWEVEAKDIEGYYLIFANQFLELLFTDPLFVFRLQFFHNSSVPLQLDETEGSYFAHQCAFDAMVSELAALKSDSEDFLRSYLLLILAGVNRRFCQTYNLSAERRLNHEAYQFKKLVESHIRSLQKVEEYAAKLQLSRVSLNKLVKSQFGITASQFIKQRLLTEIKRELLFSHKTVSEIAYELSFSEGSSLNRFFTTYEGIPPAQYRLTYQNVNTFIKV